VLAGQPEKKELEKDNIIGEHNVIDKDGEKEK